MPTTLEIITSDALSTRHGYFTRKGGASSGIFSGLNCGTGSTDQAEIVAINRREGAWVKPAPVGLLRSTVPLVIGAAAWALLVWAHPWLAGVPVLPVLH